MNKMKMRSKADAFLPVIIVLAIIGAAYYFLYTHYLANPCGAPIHYAIGNVDSRFKISSAEVEKEAEDAANRWNTESGENLFVYDPNSSMKINLVYDQRQTNVDKINAEIGSLDTSGNAIETVRKKIQTEVASYQKDLADYNATVQHWNSQGGAPADVYTQLQSEKANLDQRLAKINSEVKLFNEQIDTHNSNISQLNSEIEENQNKIITEGLYYTAEKKIDIFTFGNEEELRLVLMHELGHALSLDHDKQPTSIMYPILGQQNLSDPKPSTEDVNTYHTTCKTFQGRWKTFWQRFFHQSTVEFTQ